MLWWSIVKDKCLRLDNQADRVRYALGGGGGGATIDATAAAVKQDLPELTAGFITPIEDFEEFLTALRAEPISAQDCLERFKEAANMMTQIVNRNITMGGSKTFCKKAAVVPAALRVASLEKGDCFAFNELLVSQLRAVYRTNRFELAWIASQEEQENVLPISTAEMASSVISPADKEAFFAETAGTPAAAAPVAMPADEDEDLFGAME